MQVSFAHLWFSLDVNILIAMLLGVLIVQGTGPCEKKNEQN